METRADIAKKMIEIKLEDGASLLRALLQTQDFLKGKIITENKTALEIQFSDRSILQAAKEDELPVKIIGIIRY